VAQRVQIVLTDLTLPLGMLPAEAANEAIPA
jgi:hypothetical protein